MTPPHRDIRFTTTDDGVSIAYWEIGEGKPVIVIQNFGLSHAELEWTVPSISAFYMAMAERYQLIRFDPRGVGLSGDPPGGWGTLTPDGDQVGMSTREMGLDIKAVAEAIGLDSFALMAVQVQGPVAIAFATNHPGLVGELILCQAAPNIAESHQAVLLKAQGQIRAAEADVGTKLMYNSPWSALARDDDMERLEHLTDAADTRMKWTANSVALQWGAQQEMGHVAAPTLLLCPRHYPGRGQEMMLAESRELAAGIPTSQLVMVDGTYVPYFADQEQVLDALDRFLKPDRTPERLSGFRTVVFTDIVDSTKFMSDVGDKKGREAMRVVEERVSSLAEQHSGRVVKNLGDGSLVSFGSNTAALRFALDVQSQTDPDSLQLRIGMAAGEPIEESGDIHGAVVAYASRVADLGGAGEIVASDTVRQLAMGKGFEFTPMGQFELKGFDEPATVWKVGAEAD